MKKSIEELNQQISSLEEKRLAVLEQLQPLQNKAGRLHDQIRELKNRRDVLVLQQKGAEIDFEIMLCGDPKSNAMYKEQERQLGSLGLGRSGYWSDTNQVAVQIALTRGDSSKTATVHEGLKKILPHIIPDSDGYRRIAFLEHTLSEHGAYTLLLGKTVNDKTILTMHRYGSRHDLKEFPNLLEALEYCAEHLWYDGDEEGDEE